MNRLTIYCEIDDFCREFEPKLKKKFVAVGRNSGGNIISVSGNGTN
jgi:hypothetical protein